MRLVRLQRRSAAAEPQRSRKQMVDSVGKETQRNAPNKTNRSEPH
jgi:hypothetical protein